jgi:DNA polymerase I-like protein with 3'-5' exonuclease and polymerase domains
MKLDEMKALPPDKQEALIKKIDAARKKGKATNYAATYGAGAATIARSAGVSELEGAKLHEAYWKLNWSIPAVANGLNTKVCRKQKWLFNPVSKLWYALRKESDRWSTLNQGTGVWCFDTWVKYQRQKGLPQIGQFHDETINLVKEENKEKAEKVLRWAIDQTNKELNLNRELDIDVQFGINYSEIH